MNIEEVLNSGAPPVLTQPSTEVKHVVEHVAVETAPVVAHAVETLETAHATAPALTPAHVVEATHVAAPVVSEEEEVGDVDLTDIIEPKYSSAFDDYDWDQGKRGQKLYEKEVSAKQLELYNETMKPLSVGEVIKGRVSAISGNDVLLDLNSKSDGLLSLSDFRDIPDMKVGDYVDIYVESQEDAKGQLLLSRRKAKLLRSWEALVDSFQNGTIIRGTIISKTKGGLIVDTGGLETFLPGSQIDIKPVTDYDQYVGKIMEFKVVKINETIKNAVVSHKALIESDLAGQREAILKGLEKGQVLEGSVKNITDFGAFLDLGGVDGLLYITDISWGRITHPSEMLHLNQKLNVVVLDFDENKRRISLGLKQLQAHPWEVLPADVVEGSIVKGKIVNLEDYGAFLEINPGVEGLIHVSEVNWSNTPIVAKEFFKLNQELEARVMTIDRAERKMSLSIKHLTGDPWNLVGEKYAVGTKHTGEVKNITQFGVFVELEAGVGGMIHISDLSWTKRYVHPAEFTKVGSPIEVVILEIDAENHKLSLGHKQLEDNPWDNFESVFSIGSEHDGTILRKDERGAIVQLPYGLEAFSPIKHLKKEDGSNAEVGETLSFRVIEFNREEKRIIVSHAKIGEEIIKAAEDAQKEAKAAEVKEAKAAVAAVQNKVEKSTLGDFEALAQLREDLDNK